MEILKLNTLKVLRKSDLGYMLSDGKSEVLLHFKESLKEHNINEIVECYIYLDKQKRLCATEHTPTVLIDKPGFAKVCEIISDLGVFVNINCGKDILVSKDYLPYDKNLWPDIDDVLFINLKFKKDNITAKPLNRFEIIDLNNKTDYKVSDEISGYICKTGPEGVGIITVDLAYVFVHKTHLRKPYRLGEEVNVKIIMVKSNEYNGTLTKQKEDMIDSDALIIINYLKANNNKMSLTSKSSSEEIEKELKLSRKAFKRALGNLYKQRIVECSETQTILIKEKEL